MCRRFYAAAQCSVVDPAGETDADLAAGEARCGHHRGGGPADRAEEGEVGRRDDSDDE